MSEDVESARLEWERAHRYVTEEGRDPALAKRLQAQVEAVTVELRRRVGGTFTLRELADEYVAADDWARDVLAEQNVPGWPQALPYVQGAAFHLYARGAVDYQP